VEIQPVVLLEREQTEVHEVIQPFKQREVLPTVVDERQLPLLEKEEVRESADKFQQEYKETVEAFKSSVTVDKVRHEKEIKKPIVSEKIHKKVIEEIQPVIYKETIAPHLVKETQPVKERIVEAPKLFKEDYSHKPDLEALRKEGVEVDSFTKKSILEETIKPIQRIEVQPIVNLEREQTEIHEVIQPFNEREVLPETVEERLLPILEKEEVRESEESFKNEYRALSEKFKSSVNVGRVEHVKVVKAPVINEVIHKKVIEEIQPVIHRETIVPHLIKETMPIHERLVEAPVLIQEVLPEKDLGTTFLGGDQEYERSSLEAKKVA